MLRSFQDVIILLGRDKSWRVDLTVTGAVTDAGASRYPHKRNDFFKDPIELFQGMDFFPGFPNINWHLIQDIRRSFPQMSSFDTV